MVESQPPLTSTGQSEAVIIGIEPMRGLPVTIPVLVADYVTGWIMIRASRRALRDWSYRWRAEEFIMLSSTHSWLQRVCSVFAHWPPSPSVQPHLAVNVRKIWQHKHDRYEAWHRNDRGQNSLGCLIIKWWVMNFNCITVFYMYVFTRCYAQQNGTWSVQKLIFFHPERAKFPLK